MITYDNSAPAFLCVRACTRVCLCMCTFIHTRDLVLYLILGVCLDLYMCLEGHVVVCVCIYSVVFNRPNAETL